MRIAFLVCATALLLGARTQPNDGVERAIQQEVTRVGADLIGVVPPDGKPAVQSALTRASEALRRGQPSLAVYELEPAWEAVRAWQFVKQHEQVTTADGFADLWKRGGEPVSTPAARRVPAIADAIAAAADARAPATYRASLPFSRDTDVTSGLFYLGSAVAFADYAAFVRQLPWPAVSEDAPRFRSIAQDLSAFERNVTSEYEQMDRSQHPAYVRTSVTLKQARTLDEQGHYAGALLEYLLARYRFDGIHRRPIGNFDSAQLEHARAGLAERRDDSIASFFIDMASADLAAGDDATRTGAAAIVNDVLPAYASALAASPSAVSTTDAAQTTITLVRWPFT